MTYSRYLILLLGDNPESAIKLIHTASRTLFIMSSLFLGIFGISGNILAIKILRRRLMRDNALSSYLIWLAAMNICCLLMEMSRFLSMGLLDYNYREYSYEVCIMHRWMTIMLISVCNWFLVLITLGRWLLLRYPTRSASLFKKWRMHFLMVVTIFTIGIFQGFGLMLWFDYDFSGSEEARRYFVKQRCRMHAASLASIIIRIFVGVIPLAVLAFLSFLIFYQVKAGSRGATLHLPSNTVNRRAARERNLAILLLISNIQFMMTNVPLVAYYLTAHNFFNESSKLESALSELAGNAARMSLYGGFATNCIIYCFFGSRFRSELIKFLYENGICRKHLHRGSILVSLGTTHTTRSAYTSALEPSQRRPSSEGMEVKRAAQPDATEPETSGHRASNIPPTADNRVTEPVHRASGVDSLKYEYKR